MKGLKGPCLLPADCPLTAARWLPLPAAFCPLAAAHLECGGGGPLHVRRLRRRNSAGPSTPLWIRSGRGEGSDWGRFLVPGFAELALRRRSGSVPGPQKDQASGDRVARFGRRRPLNFEL